MSNSEQKSSPTAQQVSNGLDSRPEPLPFSAQIAALRERIAKMMDAGVENFEPASIFRIRKD